MHFEPVEYTMTFPRTVTTAAVVFVAIATNVIDSFVPSMKRTNFDVHKMDAIYYMCDIRSYYK